MKGLIRIVIFFLLTTGLSVTGWPVAAQTMSQPVHEDYQTGVKLFYEGLYEQAAGQLQEFLDTDPDRVLAEQAGYYLTLSRIALDSLRSDVYTNRFLKNHPTGPNALALLEDMAGRKYRAGDYPKAMSVYARAYRIETDVEGSARYLFWMAESARAMDSTDTSSTLYAELADRYPETDWAPRALYSRGQLYLEKEEFDRSAEMFEDLRDRYPTHPQTRQIGTALGEMYYRQERYEEAVEALRSELPYLEGEAQLKAVLLIAESHNYLGQFDEAATQYRRYINLSRDDMQARPAHYGLGWVYHKQQVFHWAGDSFARAALGDDQLARKALYYEAVNRKLGGRYDLALEAFRAFGDRFRTGFWVEHAYYEWGLTAFELGRYNLAIEVLQQLVRSDQSLEDPGRVYSLLGEAYFANNEFSRAVQAFEVAEQTAEVDPDMKRQAQFQRAWVLYENHAYREAANAFNAVYRDQPSGELAAEALFWSADSYYNQQRWTDAIQQFERFLDGYPGHRFAGAAVYSLGWAHFNIRQYEQAIRYFETFESDHEPPPMALFPYDVDTRLRLGDSYYALGRYEEAIRSYDRVVGADPGGDYAIFQMANSYYRNEQSFEAVRNFRRLIRIYPNSRLREQARYNIGYIFFQTGNYDQAIQEFHELINRFPRTDWAARAQYQIGDAYYNASQYEEAIQAYREMMESYPQSRLVVDAVNGIQFAQLAAGEEDTSLEILEEFLNDHPQTGTADQLRYRQAENLMQAGDYSEAVRSFRQYIRVTTNESMMPEAWYNIAEAYELMGEREEALAAYREIVEGYPDSDRVDPALLHIGRLEKQAGRHDRAIAALEQLVGRQGRMQVEALAALGDAHFASGNINRAEDAFNRALKRRPDHEQSLIGMGRVALQRGQLMDAETFFQRVADASMLENGARAQYYLGNVQQARRNHEEAIDAYARVSALYESFDEWVARAMLATAESYRQTGQTGRANQTLRDVMERFPDTEFARMAAEQI
ncbi:MAG: tetratricopeptide repeat protein [Cyclonatronaceae bacterium]